MFALPRTRRTQGMALRLWPGKILENVLSRNKINLKARVKDLQLALK